MATVPPKITRYRAGKVPEFAKKETAEAEKIVINKDAVVDRNASKFAKPKERVVAAPVAEIIAEGVEDDGEEDITFPDDSIEQDEEETQRAIQKSKEKIVVPVIVSRGADDDEEMEEDEDEHDRRRERLREKAKQKQKEEQEQEEMPIEPEESVPKIIEQKEEEEESEYETDDSEEEETIRPRFAPVFKTKKERETILEMSKMEEEIESLEREKKKRDEERKKETKDLLLEEMKKSIVEETKVTEEVQSDNELSSSSEEENEAEEYEKWKLRELTRIKRDQKARDDAEKSKNEMERRRQLTDAEISREDADKLKPREKAKWNFLQKYYAKGAYFRTFDENDILDPNKWNFDQPTLEDKIDKSILPSVMQVKNFGKSGRTKHTHLKDVDTTDFDSGWGNRDDPLRSKSTQKMGGMGTVGKERPNKKRK